MNNNGKIGLALVGGYLLGRTKKAKMAIGFGMFLAGKKIPLDLRELSRVVSKSPAWGALSDQVRTELVDATKSAATSALTQRVSGMTDSLHERTLALTGARPSDHDDDGAEDEARDGDEQGDKGSAGDQPAEKKPARRRSAPAARSTKRVVSKTSGAGGSSTGAARKKAASGGRNAASKGARTSPGSARRTSERGGDHD
ncbi:hypothetical protein [Streptomyces sp. NRRL B-24720]|uniref:hypothetical protein n=1 Tax=Streptomyces sp. NRRL B-24720 TaxID=1476876 RepID=UPI0006898CA0|nr:hypothetical protein [Streptomyces sp. NRRL B-24720]